MSTTYSLKISDTDVICAINIVCRLNNITEGVATTSDLKQPFVTYWKKQYDDSNTGKEFGNSVLEVLDNISKYNPMHNPLIYDENNDSWYVDRIYTTYNQLYKDYVKPHLKKSGKVYSILGYELTNDAINCLDYAFENTLGEKSITQYAEYVG